MRICLPEENLIDESLLPSRRVNHTFPYLYPRDNNATEVRNEESGAGGQSDQITQDPSHSLRTSFRFSIADFRLGEKTDGRKHVQEAHKAASLRVIKVVNALPRNRTADMLGRQLIRSGTSIR